MFRPVSAYLSMRYLGTCRRSGFISFIAWISMLGIALGITVLITVLSVMNGFDYEIRHQTFRFAREATAYSRSGMYENWPEQRERLAALPEVVAVAPLVTAQGMLSYQDSSAGVVINGIDPELEHKVSSLDEQMIAGTFEALEPGAFGVVVGIILAEQLGITVGDKVLLLLPRNEMSTLGMIPRFKSLTVVGIFKAGENSGSFHDSTMIYLHIKDAGKIAGYGDQVNCFNLKLKDLYRAQTLTGEWNRTNDEEYFTNWTEQYGAFFKAIRMEKNAMFIVLLFIIAVAAFNLVSGLVMSVRERRGDIAVLRTLGSSSTTIMAIFIGEGCAIGMIGIILGVIGGVSLSQHAPELVSFVEKFFNTQLIPTGVYPGDALPSRLNYLDVIKVSVAAFMMSFGATIFPAYKAAKIAPAVVLRHE